MKKYLTRLILLGLLFFAFVLLCGQVHAQTLRITATITVTNSPYPTNGDTLTVNGNVRTWVNANPTSAQILEDPTTGGCASNLFNALAANPFAGPMVLSQPTTNSVAVIGAIGQAMAVSLLTNWGSIAYYTNSIVSSVPVTVPFSSYVQSTTAVMVASSVVAGINTSATNRLAASVLPTSAPQFMAATNGTATGATVSGTFSGNGAGITNANYIGNTNGKGFNLTVSDASGGTLPLLALTNAGDFAGINFGSDGFGNGYIDMPANAANGGLINFGIGSGGVFPFTINRTNGNTAFGFSASVINGVFNGSGAGLGNIGGGAINSGITNTNSRLSNPTIIGTNSIYAQQLYPAFLNNSLSGSGEQADIATGTNSMLIVSGPTSAWAMDGMSGGIDGRILYVEYDGGQAVTVRNESGIDSTPTNRIRTGVSGDVTYSSSPLALIFRYNGALSRWVLMSASGPASTGTFTGTFIGNGNGLSVSNTWYPTFQDTRQMSNLEILASPTSFTNTVIFSNNGPGTITMIGISGENWDTNFYHGCLYGPTLRIIVDGVDRAHWTDVTQGHSHATNNGLSLFSFLAGDGWPSIGNNDGTNIPFDHLPLRGNIEITACYGQTLSALRNVYINFRTNCIIEVTNAMGQQIYSDVFWKVGQPVTQTSWNAFQVVNTNAGTNLFTGISLANTVGQLESIYWMFADAGSFGYVTPPIMFQVDSWTYGIGKGTEDSFGGTWAWAGGYDRYDTPKWGTYCFTGNTNDYWQHPDWYGGWPVDSGNTSWRFFTFLPQPEPGVFFNNNFSWTFDPSDGIGQDYGIGLTTYYTLFPN